MSNSKRINIFLVCETCKNRNYSTSRSNAKSVEPKTNKKVNLKKFCKSCETKVSHKELIKK